jgi:hypothetical protein
MVSVLYIFTVYLVLAASSIFFIWKNMARIDEWIWYGTLDVAIASTYLALLLLVSAC